MAVPETSTLAAEAETAAQGAYAVRAGEGDPIPGPTGQPMVVKVPGAATSGAYSVIEYSHAAGAQGPPAHIHHEHDEVFFVLEGELTVQAAGETLTIGRGEYAVVPRGVVHRPSNASAVPVRFLFVSSLAMDGFFREMAGLMSRTHGEPSAADLAAIGRNWDTEYVDLPAGPSADQRS